MIKLKTVVLFLKILTYFITHRTFGNVIHDIVQKYNNIITTTQLRKFEKLSIKVKKAEIDLIFLSNCKIFNVT